MKAIFSKIVSKGDEQKALQMVHMTDDKLVATDAYTLIEVDHSCFQKREADNIKLLKERMFEKGTNIALLPEELDMKQSILETMPLEASEGFPDYQKLIPSTTQLDSEYISIRVNPRKLAEVAMAVLRTFKDKGFGEVVLHVPKVVTKPVVIRRKDGSAVGLVMPLN